MTEKLNRKPELKVFIFVKMISKYRSKMIRQLWKHTLIIGSFFLRSQTTHLDANVEAIMC